MVSEGEGDTGPEWAMPEWEELQEFQIYFLLVCVLVDWVVWEQPLVVCLTQDIMLFMCVSLPTSSLFLLASLLKHPHTHSAVCQLPTPPAEGASVQRPQPPPCS